MTRDFWHCYFKDFVSHKLKLVDQDCAPQLDQDDTPEGNIAHQILYACCEHTDKHDAAHRVAELHVIYQLQLAKMATMLRPLSKIERVRISVYDTSFCA